MELENNWYWKWHLEVIWSDPFVPSRASFEVILGWSLRPLLNLKFCLNLWKWRFPIPQGLCSNVGQPHNYSFFLPPSRIYWEFPIWQIVAIASPPITMQLCRDSGFIFLLCSWSQQYHLLIPCWDCSSPVLSLSFITCFSFLVILVPLC